MRLQYFRISNFSMLIMNALIFVQITQKWIHRLDFLALEKTPLLEKFVGRTRDHSTELKDKPPTSHVARMTGGTDGNKLMHVSFNQLQFTPTMQAICIRISLINLSLHHPCRLSA